MKQLALKIDVNTYHGTLNGVPHLVEMLQKQEAKATFLFSLGPDHTGRAIKRVFRPGFLKKVSRTSVVSHYGLLTLMYGTLLPGPDIGKRCAEVMRLVREAGFEVGIHTWDHVKWQDGVESADNDWTARQMQLAYDRFQKIFGAEPLTHGAAGWQMNTQAVRLTQRLAFDYASDCRGTHPFMPVLRGEPVFCPQLPTTLPTLDELIGRDGITAENVHLHILEMTENAPPTGHVYTLHAELEGGKLAPAFERLLTGWREQGYELVSLRSLCEGLNLRALPRHEIIRGEVPGRAGTLMVQGPVFLGEIQIEEQAEETQT